MCHDPWYLGATATNIAALQLLGGNPSEFVTTPFARVSIVAIRSVSGAAANALLF